MAAPSSAGIPINRQGAAGALSWAPLGTTAPTSASATLNVAFKALGHIGEDGITGGRDVSTDDVRNMNGEIVRTLQTDFSRTYVAELLQSKDVDVKNLVFGSANVTTTPANTTHGLQITAVDRGEVGSHGVLVADTFDGLAHHREVALDAQPTSIEFGPLVGTGVRSYTVTWSVYAVNGVFVTEYDDDGVTTA